MFIAECHWSSELNQSALSAVQKKFASAILSGIQWLICENVQYEVQIFGRNRAVNLHPVLWWVKLSTWFESIDGTPNYKVQKLVDILTLYSDVKHTWKLYHYLAIKIYHAESASEINESYKSYCRCLKHPTCFCRHHGHQGKAQKRRGTPSWSTRLDEASAGSAFDSKSSCNRSLEYHRSKNEGPRLLLLRASASATKCTLTIIASPMNH